MYPHTQHNPQQHQYRTTDDIRNIPHIVTITTTVRTSKHDRYRCHKIFPRLIHKILIMHNNFPHGLTCTVRYLITDVVWVSPHHNNPKWKQLVDTYDRLCSSTRRWNTSQVDQILWIYQIDTSPRKCQAITDFNTTTKKPKFCSHSENYSRTDKISNPYASHEHLLGVRVTRTTSSTRCSCYA